MVRKQKELDITKTGPVGYRSLQAQNNAQFDEVDRFINESQNRILSRASQSDPYRDTQQMVKSPLAGTGTSWGESIWDNKSANQASFENLGDIRAENQPWYAQIGAGLAKGAILAGTTFLDGTLGLLFGAGTAINEDRWSGLWDNDFSKAMQSINEWSEQALPNYYTKAEQEQPWYENIFTANFLGDKFIKNLGFTVGAFYSGGVTAAGLKATKLPQLIGAIAKSSKAPKIVTSAVGATISAVNEGRIEALNNSKDWFELHKAQLDDEYHQRLQYIKNAYEGTEVYDQLIRAEQENYNQALGRLSEDRLKMGNVDLLMNIPILTASNIIQFGKLYANGFKTARKATNIVGRAGEYTAGTTRLGATTAITKGALSEGTEEISQKAASVISGNYYSTDVNNFYKSKTDPEAAQETLSWTKSFAEGINETVNDGSSWEEFFIGSLTGALGMPRFRGIRNAEGRLQSPITIEGGAINEWRDYNEKIARENEIANYMNDRVNSPEFKNYYQGLIRHNKYQNDMNRAAEEGDEFNFKNAEHAQLVSDIAMFDNAGKMEDLTTLIDAAFDTSDENLASIVENTTTTLEDGSKVGPFVDKNGNPMYATPEGKQEMIKKLQENHDEMTNTINNYLKIKDELDIKTGQQLSDDQLEELTWMKSQIGNWAERATSMSGEVKSAIGNVIGNLDSLLRFNQQVRDFEGQHNANLTDRYKQADKNVKTIEGAINTLNMVRGQDDSVLAHTLATNPKFVDGLIKELNEVDETVLSADEKEDITTKLNDIVKLGNASKTYNAKLKEYLENPQKQAEDHARADEQAAQQETKKKSDDLKASLNAAQNLQEFRSTIDAQDDTENRDKVLKELEDEGSEMAKNYRETSQYNNEVRRVLNESDAEPQVKQDAMKLLQDQFNNSDNLEYLANPNSIYINNENAFDEDSEGDVDLSATRFQEAQYELQKAMSKVNNDNRFKDRFSPEYKKPVEKREGTVRGDDRTTTGDSGTSTTPPVTSSEGLPTTELPVGNITAEMVREENKKANERVEDPQEPTKEESKQYYKPAIPELHIKASKKGDFRPFDIVVSKREKGVDFSGIYGYLRDSGAFRYINEGNLKAGDELGFMIDPSFNDHTIFIIDKRNGQVVGSLDESDYSVSRYEGLKGLEEKIRKEYAERSSQSSKPSDDEVKNFIIEETIKYYRDVIGNPLTKESIDIMNKTSLGGLYTSTYASSLLKDPAFKNKVDDFAKSTNQKGKFIATPTTKVSKVMVGRIPYDNTDRSLSEIPNVSSTDRRPIFGIIKNGVLTTNSKIDGNLIIKPVDMSQKEGRLYLLIPNGAGKYSPAAVRVKHFNNEEFNLNDSSVNSTPVGEDIKNAITKLSTATSQDDVSAAMQDLAQDLYMQDIMVTWFNSKEGDGIVISKKVRKPDGTYEKVIIEGKEQIKEDKYDVYFSNFGKSTVIGGLEFALSEDVAKKVNDERFQRTIKNPEDIYNEILGHLVKFNLPLQVSVRRINEGAYNNRLINSNILTSNITEASVKSNWFTTDYFDNEGNLHQAINPASVAPQPKRKVETPVGGTEGAIAGTRIVSVFSNKPYYVDLKTNTIRDDQGRIVRVTDSNRILFDLAWAQDNFGNATNSSMMVDNKVLTPDGKVLDRNKQRYLSGQEAQDVKDTIAGRKKEREDRVAKSKEIISEIYENQKRVDKTRTDSEFYYVLEDDGEYHQYSRVHSRLGSNWVESPKQTKALKDIEIQLSKLVMSSPTGYNNYLDTIGKKFEVDLSAFHNKMGIKDRQTIVNTIRDRMSGTNSQRALDAGTAVDSIIRQYFTVRDVSKIVRPSNMSESAFVDLITSLNKIKSNMELLGERFLADNIVLFQKYPDGTRVAGEVDILSVDKGGNFRIYDVKTSRYSFSDFTDRYGHKVNYFTTPSATQRMSAKDYYTLQLSAYKNLFESQYGVPVTKLAIMPFVLSYDKKNVSAVQSEKGIPITYNPAVNVPLVSNVKVDKSVEAPAIPAQAQTVLPIFETSLETQNPIEDLTPEHKSTDKDKVGYFELDGKLHKGYITPLTVIDGIKVHVTKIPNITKGFGIQGEIAYVGSNSFYAVFPNGKTFLLVENNPVQGGMSESQVEDYIRKSLLDNPQRMRDFASEKTILFDPDAVPTVSAAPVTTVETPATINQGNTQTGAAYTVQKEQAIDNKKASRTRHKLRKVKSPDYEKWDEKRELEWLNKVLPQLSESDRVKVVKGLIKVGKRGALAWGQFDKGVITLSDIAAEGTAYHEAFHVVFNLLLDNNERQALYDEAKKLYGEKDNLSLEEDMAEGFREYVTTRQNAGLLGKIKNFFKDLWIKITNWNSVRPHLTAYYQMINRGEYSNRELPVETLSQDRARQEETNNDIRYREVTNKEQVLRQETQAFLDNFDISIKDLDNYDSDVPLFDALNRVINVKNANDITEGVGYAVAFMMQYNPRISELINLHIHGSETFRLKGIRRSIRNRGTFSLDLSSRERRAINRQEAIRQIGADIAVELRKLYNLETPKDTSNSYIKNIWNVIKEFFEKLTPGYRSILSIIANNTNQIANAIKLNDPSIIRATVNKPGTNTAPERVDIGKALVENPYEDNIIRTLQEYNIALAGSASIAIEGTLYRPSENPLHDIDFNAVDYNREQLDTIIDKEFPHNTHIRTIKDGENKTTETYLILDRDFYTEKVEGLGLYKLIDKNTKEVLGSYVGSELTLKDGVQGKFLDFFIGKGNSLFGNKKVLLNNREYLISDYRNAFQAKIDWNRLKDIWDYNRFVSSGKVKTLEALRAESERNLKNKLQNARVIWGHPAIGKTTYLERNDDILEWDDLVNKKRNEFLRNQIDPSHTMDIESKEYKHLRSEYIMNWKKHPEYVKFLTDEWNNLIARAKRENKRVFASPLPLLEIGRKDIDLIVALGDRTFTERDIQRGNTLYGSRGWKQNIDKELLKQDPTKIVYTEDYFSDFMRKNLGVTWGTLNETEEEMLLAKGWTKERFDSISQEERDQAVKCIAF